MTEKHRRKKVRDAAEELCWGIALGASLGLTDQEIMGFIKKDLQAWIELVDWKNYR